MRVLIADDHEVIRTGVRQILSREDIEFHEASDGHEAVRKAVELQPDVIILDLTMPGMGGFVAAKELRRVAPDIPILIFSIYDDARLMQEAKSIGARGYVCKHDACETLLNAVKEIVFCNGTFFPDSMDPEAVDV